MEEDVQMVMFAHPPRLFGLRLRVSARDAGGKTRAGDSCLFAMP
jgi:hypothetical protein